MRDEPTAEMLKETGVGYNLKTIYDYIRTNDRQERPIQINLLGGMGEGNEAKYKEYLDTFETNFGPNLWSYDLYPITQDSCLINIIYIENTKEKEGIEGIVKIAKHIMQQMIASIF